MFNTVLGKNLFRRAAARSVLAAVNYYFLHYNPSYVVRYYILYLFLSRKQVFKEILMQKINSEVTDSSNFFEGTDPTCLADYGTPLYVYNERILRERCREIKNLSKNPRFKVHFSAKANSNPALLQIIRSEGILADAMSPGELAAVLAAGYEPSEIFYVTNNVSADEMKNAVKHGCLMSVDSLSQLDLLGSVNPGGETAIRLNPGIGAGHHDKVITGGKNTKFGINEQDIPSALEILKKHSLKCVGINQHVGSLFMEPDAYMQGAQALKRAASHFKDLRFIDLGGGFGIPYRKQENEPRLDLASLGERLDLFISELQKDFDVDIKIEPGRYITAECGLLLGRVNAVKHNGDKKYIGTDLGFNILMRPVLYEAHHEIEIYRSSGKTSEKRELVDIVGNICESGDIIAANRLLPEIFEGDLISVLDAGAYGSSMSSNYNLRLRSAEVLIREDGSLLQIRERDEIGDLLKKYKLL